MSTFLGFRHTTALSASLSPGRAVSRGRAAPQGAIIGEVALLPVWLHLYRLPDARIRRIILRCFQIFILILIGIDFRLFSGASSEYLFFGHCLLGIHVALLVWFMVRTWKPWHSAAASGYQGYLLFGAGLFIVGWHG
jgi:hypothetical protein